MRPIVSLFDNSAHILRPWAEAGFECHALDASNSDTIERFTSGGIIYFGRVHFPDYSAERAITGLHPALLFSFSPCTDLAVCGNKWFPNKFARNRYFLVNALHLATLVERLANSVDPPAAWSHENPVGLLTRLWRPADFTFHPYEFGGWLPENDVHPRFPEIIVPRDAYPKKTLIRHGNGFIEPTRRPVENHFRVAPQYALLGGGNSVYSARVRSETPRGYSLAVFHANYERVSRL